MQRTIENLRSPFFQLIVYYVIVIILALVSWFYAPAVIMSGVCLLSIWMLAGTIYGVGQTVSWHYYLQLAGCLLVGYVRL